MFCDYLCLNLLYVILSQLKSLSFEDSITDDFLAYASPFTLLSWQQAQQRNNATRPSEQQSSLSNLSAMERKRGASSSFDESLASLMPQTPVQVPIGIWIVSINSSFTLLSHFANLSNKQDDSFNATFNNNNNNKNNANNSRNAPVPGSAVAPNTALRNANYVLNLPKATNGNETENVADSSSNQSKLQM